MGALLFHIVFISIGAAAGAAAGWVLRGGGPRKPPSEPVAQEQEQEEEQNLDMVETVMSRLHELTVSMAADVGEHTSRVQAIHHELTTGADVVSVVERLVKANEQMQSQLKAAEQRMQEQSQEIESHMKEARTDVLTELSNRRAFDDALDRCVEAFRTCGRPCCVMMIDIDHFKKVNDTYGHQAGDEVLRNIGQVLRRNAAAGEVVCRYGGEEFAIIYPALEIAAVIPRAEAVRAAVAFEVTEIQGLDLKVTASAGLAQLQPNESEEALVKRADLALYVSKESGRNCGYWHNGIASRPMRGVSHPEPLTTVTKTKPPPASSPSKTDNPAAEGSVFRLTEETKTSRTHRRDRPVGLSDSETFCRDLDRRVAEYRRDQGSASLVLLAVDDCERLDELYGAKAVELARRAAAQIIKASVREMDHAARFDDQVFALMLPGAGIVEACTFAERLRVAMQAYPLPVDGDSLPITVSVGVVEFRPQDERESLLDRARQSLAAAIKAGGNRTITITPNGEYRSVVDTRR